LFVDEKRKIHFISLYFIMKMEMKMTFMEIVAQKSAGERKGDIFIHETQNAFK
jgi:hypothetical protein